MNADYSFTLRASTGETFTVLHFPDRPEFRQFETTDGERVEGELVPEGGGHTSMRFWVHRGRSRSDDDGALVVDFQTDRIAAVMVEGSERRL